MHRGGYTRFGQALLQRFAVGYHDGVLCVNAGTVGADGDRLDGFLWIASLRSQ